jgi:DNA mismatch repair protein MutS
VIDQVGNEIGNKTKLKRRAVVRVVSPGTIFDDFSYNNFVMAVCMRDTPGALEPRVGIAWADVSTGEFYVSESSLDSFSVDIIRISPAEVIIDENMSSNAITKSLEKSNLAISLQPTDIFDLKRGRKRLDHLIKTHLSQRDAARETRLLSSDPGFLMI